MSQQQKHACCMPLWALEKQSSRDKHVYLATLQIKTARLKLEFWVTGVSSKYGERKWQFI